MANPQGGHQVWGQQLANGLWASHHNTQCNVMLVPDSMAFMEFSVKGQVPLGLNKKLHLMYVIGG